MNVDVSAPALEETDRRLYAGGALAGIAVVSAAWVMTLYAVVSVLGGVVAFVAGALGALVLALLLGRWLSGIKAFALAVLLLAGGLGVYLLSVPPSYWQVFTIDRLISDLIALLTGYSVLQMTQAGTWAVGVLPGPLFLTWFFAWRGEYIRATTVAALVLGFFVLTGDATLTTTLVGVLGAAGTVAFATLERHGGSRRHAEVLAATIAVMILASTVVSAVPGGNTTPLFPDTGPTVQSNLAAPGDRQTIHGSLRLSPKVRFVVEAEEAAYWRVGTYDRFTGNSWLRTGTSTPVNGPLQEPPGPRETLYQQVIAKQQLDVLPAAAKPIRITGTEAAVTEHGSLTPVGTLGTNESYGVVSSVSTATPAQLRTAGRDYPSWLSDTYFELPSNTPKRVSELTANITEETDSAYGAAKAIEQWLETNKQYSLTVERPTGNIADAFLFEMNQGYCVYYATTMVTMLRSQGIPARYVVGYTSGQRVAEDTWVVRGLDSHAWVEVYFPDYGWIKFDPTPSLPRQAAEQDRVAEARANDVAGVDARDSQRGTWTPTTTAPPTVNGTTNTTTNGTANGTTIPGLTPSLTGPLQGQSGVGDPADVPTTPSQTGGWVPTPPAAPETMAVWGVLAVGLAAGARRTGVADRTYRSVWLHYQPSRDPRTDVEGAFDRVMYLLERRHRKRRPGETVREYLTAIDPPDDALAVARLREQAVHAGTVSAADASTARRRAASYVESQAGTAATVFNRLVS
ncbi:MAG: transglutaminaseTgpA domain-containing protein [Halobacteriaceae archaeon]